MVAEKTYEYNGLVLGSSQFPVVLVEGLDSPALRESISHRHSQHGSWVHGQYSEERRIMFTGHIQEAVPADFAARVASLRNALVPQAEDLALRYRLPGEGDRRVYCKPTRKSFPYTPEAAQLGYMEWVVEMIAGDPLLYDDTEQSLPLAVGIVGVANNGGAVGTWPRVLLTGPLTNPVITNESVNLFVKLNTVIGAAEVVEVDFSAKTIRKAGVSLYPSLDPTSDWWPIEPGPNNLRLTADAGAGEGVVEWRSAWL